MRKSVKKGFAALGIILFSVAFIHAAYTEDTFKIDPTHSTLGFSVKHMKVGTTRGVFTDFFGEVTFDEENLDTFNAMVVIKAESIDTRLEERDRQLRSSDFFDAANYPTIIFRSKKLVKKSGGYEITGELTMKGVTKEVSGPAVIAGPAQSPFGGEIIGISGSTVINRRDFGISWNDAMPDGGFVVGNEVTITIDIEADKK